MAKQDTKSLVMIVGMHRSGTSAVGRLLENMGFEFGSNLLEGIHSVNDDGFWEDKDVVALNEHIFELYGFRWFDFERMPGKWWEDDQIKDLVGVAETWYYESFSGEIPIAVKDPRFCRLLPFWKRVFQGLDLDLHVLFVYRHPVEVAASLQKRDGFPAPLGYLLWLSYTIDALYYSRNLSLSLLRYDELLETPNKVINRLIDKDISHISLFSEINKSTLAESSLDPSRYHQKSEKLLTEFPCRGDIQALATELYEELLTASADVAKGLADKYRKRLYRLLDHNKEILFALREETHSQVLNVKKLFKLGDDHAHALAVIGEKDAQLEENKNFIKRCLDEIQNKDVLLKSTENSSPLTEGGSAVEAYAQRFDGWMVDLNKLVDDYRSRIEEQNIYIKKCEENLALREKGLADNQEYIAKCHSRIAEQDIGIAENRGYIIACEERIRVQDEGLGVRDGQLSEKEENIVSLERNVAQLQEQLSTANADLLGKNQNLQLLVEQERIHKERIEEGAASLSRCEARIIELNLGISENRDYISTCEERIRVQDEGLGIRDRQLSEKEGYILSLERNLAQVQEQLSVANVDLLEKGQQVQLLMEQELKQKSSLEESTASVAKYQARILEQDVEISKNRDYISTCEERIRVQDETLVIKNRYLEEKIQMITVFEQAELQLKSQLDTQDGYIKDEKQKNQLLSEKLHSAGVEAASKESAIDRLEKLEAINRQRIALQKVQLEKLKAHAAALESELVALRAEHAEWKRDLDRYRSYRAVKIIEKLFPESEK